MQKDRKITFSGQVQGVGFRYTAHRIANRHDLTGYVRNMPDGTVQMLAQGTAADIQAFLTDIQDYFSGYIRNISITKAPHDPRTTDFRITY